MNTRKYSEITFIIFISIKFVDISLEFPSILVREYFDFCNPRHILINQNFSICKALSDVETIRCSSNVFIIN